MAKFCGKCGTKLDEQTGKCPNCDKEIRNDTLTSDNNSGVNENQKIKESNRKDRKKGKRKKPKTILIIIIVIAVLLSFISVGAIGLMVYNEKLDIPYVNSIFISLGIKDEELSNDHNTDETNNNKVDNSGNTSTTTDEGADLSNNYEVPDFDAEEYFKENTILKSTSDVSTSQDVSTEAEAFDNFVERGFEGYQVTFEYAIDGTYLGTKEISRYSSSKHPIYQAYYTTTTGDIWMIFEINGSYFAIPISYNFSNEKSVSVMISETDTITSYDSTTNKFYVNIPNESQTIIKTVETINAETLEKLNSEEIDKL